MGKMTNVLFLAALGFLPDAAGPIYSNHTLFRGMQASFEQQVVAPASP